MIRVLNDRQQEVLLTMSNKYLKTTNTKEQSIEIEDITETIVYFWKYDANAEDGDQFELPWLQFVMFQLFPVMFKSQFFKFNAVAAKYFFRPAETREDLFIGLIEFDKYMDSKKADSSKELAKKDKVIKQKQKQQQTS